MHTALRPWVTSGIAIVGASVIAVAPVAPIPGASPPTVHIAEVQWPTLEMPVQLTSSVADILTFPAFREYIRNTIAYVAIAAVGVGQSAAGVGQAIVAFPSAIVTVTQQLLDRDPLAALTTIEEGLVSTVTAVGGPLLDAIIQRRQMALVIQAAMQEAVPAAIIEFATGIGVGVDEVLRAFIKGGQAIAGAALPLDLGNLVNAIAEATGLVLNSFGAAAQAVVDGTVAAQQTIAKALATRRPAPMDAGVSEVEGSSPGVVPNFNRSFATLSLDETIDESDTKDKTEASDDNAAVDGETLSGQQEVQGASEVDGDQTETGDDPNEKTTTPTGTSNVEDQKTALDKDDSVPNGKPRHQPEADNEPNNPTNGQVDANKPTGANKNDPGGDTTNAPKNESNNETNKSGAANGGSNAA